MHLITKVSRSVSDLNYSYDEDWSYDGQFGNDGYVGFDEYLRKRVQTDFDVRLISDEDGKIFNSTTAWTLGGYYRDQNEKLTRNYTSLYSVFKDTYNTDTKAIYGQLDTVLRDRLVLTTGLRIEKWKADYYSDPYTGHDDNWDPKSIPAYYNQTDDTLKGGKIGLTYTSEANDLYYINLTKGYKPGGFNTNTDLPAESRSYLTETLWNIDLGVNSSYLNDTLKHRFNIFYGQRRDMQVKDYKQNFNVVPTEFNEFLSNAAKAHYYGLESMVDYFPTDTLHLFASIGLLKTAFDNHVIEKDLNGDGDTLDAGEIVNMTGRETANAPFYQYNIGLAYDITSKWIFKANIEGKDDYYFSDSHNEKARSYNLINSSFEYLRDQMSVSLWARNITNKEYDARGFGTFGNNPENGWMVEDYRQLATPRTFGVTLSYDF
jgi:hypothetical protein